jgi:hypothetical protein
MAFYLLDIKLSRNAKGKVLFLPATTRLALGIPPISAPRNVLINKVIKLK